MLLAGCRQLPEAFPGGLVPRAHPSFLPSVFHVSTGFRRLKDDPPEILSVFTHAVALLNCRALDGTAGCQGCCLWCCLVPNCSRGRFRPLYHSRMAAYPPMLHRMATWQLKGEIFIRFVAMKEHTLQTDRPPGWPGLSEARLVSGVVRRRAADRS